MRSKRLAAIGTAIVDALCAAAEVIDSLRRRRHEAPDVRACNEMLRIREMAMRQGWGPSPDWWPQPWRDRFRHLADTIQRHHHNAP